MFGLLISFAAIIAVLTVVAALFGENMLSPGAPSCSPALRKRLQQQARDQRRRL